MYTKQDTQKMTDIFDAKILCKKCNKEMKQVIVNRNGLELRAVECLHCKDKIIHPADLNAQENFKDLKDKKFNVKLRMVGNSHAVSIPKEIFDFMNGRQREMHKNIHRNMDNMVRLWFDDFDTLKMGFFDNDMDEEDEMNDDVNYDDGNRKVKRRVRNDGRGNVDIVEEQSLNEPNRRLKSFRIKKIRRFSNDKE